MMKSNVLRSRRLVALCLALGVSHSALAFTVVFDPSNYAQNVVTAAKAVKAEIYQNTNIVYQYAMMQNQLLQASKLSPTAMLAAYKEVSSDIDKAKSYGTTLTSLYGSLSNSATWMSKVQSLITQSGKTSTQWFADMQTLRANNDKSATALFQMGSDAIQHTQTFATRRAELQTQLDTSPTGQATAEITTHYLDIVASQNNDMLQMMAAQQQRASQKASLENSVQATNDTAMKEFVTKQDTQRAALNTALPLNSVSQ